MTKKYEVVSVENNPDDSFVSYNKRVLGEEQDDYTPANGERLFGFSFLKDSHRKLIGKTLTLIDASISDDRQCEAMKDMVRAIYNEELCFISEWGYDQDIIQEALADVPDEHLEPVDVEEALNS